jgi:hypothetical protein
MMKEPESAWKDTSGENENGNGSGSGKGKEKEKEKEKEIEGGNEKGNESSNGQEQETGRRVQIQRQSPRSYQRNIINLADRRKNPELLAER